MKFMATCGVHDFALKDIYKPEYKRLKFIFSAIINFAKYREDNMPVFETLIEQSVSPKPHNSHYQRHFSLQQPCFAQTWTEVWDSMPLAGVAEAGKGRGGCALRGADAAAAQAAQAARPGTGAGNGAPGRERSNGGGNQEVQC
jgi:hypothetical protein